MFEVEFEAIFLFFEDEWVGVRHSFLTSTLAQNHLELICHYAYIDRLCTEKPTLRKLIHFAQNAQFIWRGTESKWQNAVSGNDLAK